MPCPSGVVLFLALLLCGCGATAARSGIDAGGDGHGAAGHAGTDGATATGGAPTTGGDASATGGAAGTRGMAGNGGAAGGGGAASGGGGIGGAPSGGPSCDSNGDGLDDVASCVTEPASLRLVNATSSQTFDVYVTGALHPLATGLAPYQVVVVGPVQATLLDYEFRASGTSAASSNSKLTGETNLLTSTSGATTLIVYLDPTSSAGTLATNAAPQPPVGSCASGAEIAIGDFTTLTPTPVVVFFSAGQAVNWTPAVSPGLAGGQIVDTSCWNGGASIRFGAGTAGVDSPTFQYQAVVFASSLSYQLLLTDDRIIVIDNLDRVSNLPKL